jgi:hypothetical protein
MIQLQRFQRLQKSLIEHQWEFIKRWSHVGYDQVLIKNSKVLINWSGSNSGKTDEVEMKVFGFNFETYCSCDEQVPLSEFRQSSFFYCF